MKVALETLFIYSALLIPAASFGLALYVDTI